MPKKAFASGTAPRRPAALQEVHLCFRPHFCSPLRSVRLLVFQFLALFIDYCYLRQHKRQ